MKCCNTQAVYVDNVPGKEYYYCRSCKKEVNDFSKVDFSRAMKGVDPSDSVVSSHGMTDMASALKSAYGGNSAIGSGISSTPVKAAPSRPAGIQVYTAVVDGIDGFLLQHGTPPVEVLMSVHNQTILAGILGCAAGTLPTSVSGLTISTLSPVVGDEDEYVLLQYRGGVFRQNILPAAQSTTATAVMSALKARASQPRATPNPPPVTGSAKYRALEKAVAKAENDFFKIYSYHPNKVLIHKDDATGTIVLQGSVLYGLNVEIVTNAGNKGKVMAYCDTTWESVSQII